MRSKLVCVGFALSILASCGGGSETPSPTPPDLTRSDLTKAVLGLAQIGEGWDVRESPGPNTVQIGGKVGAASVRPAIAESTSAFNQTEGTGFVSNTILLLRTESVARAVIGAHEDAAKTTSWTQDRDDGGTTLFTFSGAVQGLPALGDEMFAARLKVDVTAADESKSELAVEYVVFSVGALVAFVVAQDAQAGVLARRLEPRVARLLS